MGNNIRIGKDFNVQWAINKVVDGERLPYDLVGKELQLYIVNDNGRKEVAGWKVQDNVIEWTYLGKDQRRLGAYQLVLVENAGKEGMVTVDTCKAFNLVEHSCEENVDGGNDIVVKTVTLESEVALAPVVKEVGESYDDTEIKGDIAELREKDAQTDAKLAELSEEVEKLTDEIFEESVERIPLNNDRYFNGMNVKVGSTYTAKNGTTGTGVSCVKIAIKEGELYKLVGKCNTYGYKGYWITDSNNVVTRMIAEVDSYDVELVIEGNESTLYVNCLNYNEETDGVWKYQSKSLKDFVTETYEEIKTIEVDTPASYYGRVLFDEPILAGTLIKSIEIVGDVTWFYWANGIGSMFTDAQISAASAPMVLDKDVYGVAAPSSTSVHVKIVTSMGEKVIDKVARIDEDVQNWKSGKKWEGKTIVAFGDSITHFIGTDQKTYSDHLAEITGANVINCGIGGSTYRQRATPEDSTTNENTARAALDIVNMVKAAITQNFTAQVNAAALITTHQPYTLDYEVQVNNLVGVDWDKVDAVIFFGGTNDFANVGQLLGEDNSTNLSETKGALNYILTEFCKTYPKVKINFLTPIVRYVDPPQFSTSKQYNVGDVTMYQGGRYKFINAHSGAWNTADVQTITSYEARVDATWGDNYKNAGGMTLREYGEALGAFVKKVYHIVPIDMYNIGWNRVNFDNYFVNTDATHPLTGFKALAEVMAKKLDL